MEERDGAAALHPATGLAVDVGTTDDLPPGDHPLEVAARRGIGPLSLQGKQVWHGGAVPCVSCGQLVPRGQDECDSCGQDLTPEMIEKMRAHAGPWYVLEHVRPFPGVSFERIVRQIRRGLLTATSIVRGPFTDYQWRFAVETPGLCLYFGKCWHCHAEVAASDSRCRICLEPLAYAPAGATRGATPALQNATQANLCQPMTHIPAQADILPDASATAQQRDRETSPQLAAFSAMLERQGVTAPTLAQAEPAPRIGGVRATWIVVAMATVAFIALIWFTRTRDPSPARTRPTPPAAAPATNPSNVLPVAPLGAAAESDAPQAPAEEGQIPGPPTPAPEAPPKHDAAMEGDSHSEALPEHSAEENGGDN